MKINNKIIISKTASLLTMVFLIVVSCNKAKKQSTENSLEEQREYQNPLNVEFGDPFILDDNNGTYLFGICCHVKPNPRKVASSPFRR